MSIFTFCLFGSVCEKKLLLKLPSFFIRYALVDFGLAQGTADTQIELLKVVSLHKGGGSTGKQDNTQRSKAAAKVPPKTSTASTSAAGPQQQHTLLPSSSPSTASSSSSSRKALVKKAHSVTVNVPTTNSCSKRTKVSALYRYSTL